MNRLTKLIRIDGFTLDFVRFSSSDSTFVIWKNFRMYILSKATITRRAFIKNTQRSNIRFGGIQKNSGYSKTLKSYEYGTLIVKTRQILFPLLPWRRVGCKFLSTKLNIISKECVQLVNLRKINFENKLYVNKNLIHVIADLRVLTLAFNFIKYNSSLVNENKLSLDILSEPYLKKLSIKLRSGQFWLKYKKSYRLTTFSKTREITIDEKIVQKVLELVLKSIFESSFLNNSHGFRLNRGTHTALKMIKHQFFEVSWILEGSIPYFLNEADNSIILDLLHKKISCDKTISLIYRGLRRIKLFNQNKFIGYNDGMSQEKILGLVLCNIYLNELDKFLYHLKLNFPEKLYFIRYLDKFIVGISGSFRNVLEVKGMVKDFLENNLNLNNFEIKIIDMRKNHVFFLETIIKRNYNKEKLNNKYYPLCLNVPILKLFEKSYIWGFFRKVGVNYYPTFVGKLINLDHSNILCFYNLTIKEVLNYYSFADNYRSLNSWIYQMKLSCARTLALKYKVRYEAKIFKKFGRILMCPRTHQKLYIPSSFVSTLTFQINPPIPFGRVIFLKKRICNSVKNKKL